MGHISCPPEVTVPGGAALTGSADASLPLRKTLMLVGSITAFDPHRGLKVLLGHVYVHNSKNT